MLKYLPKGNRVFPALRQIKIYPFTIPSGHRVNSRVLDRSFIRFRYSRRKREREREREREKFILNFANSIANLSNFLSPSFSSASRKKITEHFSSKFFNSKFLSNYLEIGLTHWKMSKEWRRLFKTISVEQIIHFATLRSKGNEYFYSLANII